MICFTAESPAEQQLYTAARLHNSPDIMPVGYSNSGGGNYYNWGHDLTSVNDPVAWPNHWSKDQVIRNAEMSIRLLNILRNMVR